MGGLGAAAGVSAGGTAGSPCAGLAVRSLR